MVLAASVKTKFDAIDSAISFPAPRWPDERQGRGDDALKSPVRSSLSIATNNSPQKHKNKDLKKEYSAPTPPPPQPKPKKSAKEITAVTIVTNGDRCRFKVLPQSNSDDVNAAAAAKIDGSGGAVLGLFSREEETSTGMALPPHYFPMDDRTRKLVEMANRYLRKHPSEDGDGDRSPTKRQRL